VAGWSGRMLVLLVSSYGYTPLNHWCDIYFLFIYKWSHAPGPTSCQKAQAEVIARNQYMAGDDRDPSKSCLLYFALGKVRLVHGLWKQAAWHPEQKLMLKFLSNDFDDPRWRTAALKNAYALLSKQRFGECIARDQLANNCVYAR
jgi:rabconnectin-3a